MANTVTHTNNLSLRSILEKDKLTGSNFLDWERNLMIVLRHERKWYVLEEPLGEAPPATAPAAARNAHKKHSDDLLDVACLMLATMSPYLQAGLINTNAYDMIRQLRDMFQTQARTERYDATKAFNECKMVKGTSVSDHVMKMKRHLDHLERLGHPVPLQLATDTILNSLSEDYRPFVVNYNMNNMEKSIAELHSMLKTAELNMGNKNKTKDVLMVRDGGVKKKNGHASTSKGKGPVQAVQSAPKKGKGKGKGTKVKPNKARTENRCFTCNEVGHWRQNCPKRHEAGSYDQLLNNSYKCCRLKAAQIFDRVANIGRDPQLRLLLGISHNFQFSLTLPLNRRRHSSSRIPVRFLRFRVVVSGFEPQKSLPQTFVFLGSVWFGITVLNPNISHHRIGHFSPNYSQIKYLKVWMRPYNIQNGEKLWKKKWQLLKETRYGTKLTYRKGRSLWDASGSKRSNGSVERYKARLVAKGYTQTHGVDYLETFAPVAKMNTVRILLSLAANFDWPLLQFDVKNALLHGNLEEEVYMEAPPGFNKSFDQRTSPRTWFGRFTHAMKKMEFKKSQGDYTLFVKKSEGGKLVAEFEIKELGKLKYFLGIEVAYSKEGIFLSQWNYILDLLKETGMLGFKPSNTPMEQGYKLGCRRKICSWTGGDIKGW
ncbi:hypothetical protein OSB04_016563 [Centaurea solstitialis]|uniref:CCHC-type domain-containing protein n=1 Tax=Centaurea solstitialis TaxID=347529 RepID=A0AA38TL73_9ASTR|nr:hypothetical protein OSB04_016563 [Centaurea solstitialis]